MKNTIYRVGLPDEIIVVMWFMAKLIWIYFLIYFITSSHRIVHIVLHISFYDGSNVELDEQTEEQFTSEDEKYREIQERYSIANEEDTKQREKDSTP